MHIPQLLQIHSFCDVAGNKWQPKQHADLTRDLHRPIRLSGGVCPGGCAIHARRHERWRLRIRLSPPLWVRHPPRRPLPVFKCRPGFTKLQRRRRQQQHRVSGHGGIPDPGEQPAHREAYRGVGGDRQQPALLHHPEDQVCAPGQHCHALAGI